MASICILEDGCTSLYGRLLVDGDLVSRLAKVRDRSSWLKAVDGLGGASRCSIQSTLERGSIQGTLGWSQEGSRLVSRQIVLYNLVDLLAGNDRPIVDDVGQVPRSIANVSKRSSLGRSLETSDRQHTRECSCRFVSLVDGGFGGGKRKSSCVLVTGSAKGSGGSLGL